MNRVFDATSAVLRFSDLPEVKCPDGVLATGVDMLGTTEALEVGVWEHPFGTPTTWQIAATLRKVWVVAR